MPTVLKIYRGTPRSDSPSLCGSCRYGLVRSSGKHAHEEVHCALSKGPVAAVITECNRHEDRAQPTLFDMQMIAWVLEIDSKRQKLGFISAAESRRRDAE